MVNQNFKSAISIEKPASEVFAAILNVRSWWSGLFEESFEGASENLGDEFSFRAGGGLHYSKQKLIELVRNEKLVWLVTEANLSFLEKTDEWVGTKISFTLSSNNQQKSCLNTKDSHPRLNAMIPVRQPGHSISNNSYFVC